MTPLKVGQAQPVQGVRPRELFQPAPKVATKSLDSFDSASTNRALADGPPPLSGRTESAWQLYSEQFRNAAQTELSRKRSSVFPDAGVQAIVGAGGGPVYVGHWSTAPGKENTPLFFQNFPNDQDPKLQLYSFPRDGQWVSFEVANDFYKAYDSAEYMNGARGTSSPLGFPNSGSEFAVKDAQWPGFVRDTEVAQKLKDDGSVNYQAFERGYLVKLGNGSVQAFDLEGKRTGGTYPGGRIDGSGAPAVGATPGTNAQGVYKSVFQPYEVAPGISVPSRVGVHWGPMAEYSNVERINKVADELKNKGVGFATVIVNAQNVQGQAPTLKALLDRGIQPVIRLLPSGDYNKTMDQLSEGELQQLASASKELKDMGVKMVQLDNEPNWEEGGKKLYGLLNSTNPPGQSQEYKDAMGRYTKNTARAMELINQQAPGMGIGFAGFSPGKEGGKQMWQDLMFGMKFYNQQSGGKLLEHAFVSVHPYSAGGGNQGVEYAEWERKNAGEILGFPIRTLATEGGNPTDRPDQQKVSSDINQQQLREMGTNPNATQSFWIIGDYYLRGATGPVESWERSALIDQNGNSSTWWSTLGQIAQGQISK